MINGIKLTNGTEMIAKIISVTADKIVLSHPMELSFTQNGMIMIPTTLIADNTENMELNTNAVMLFPYQISSAIEEQYTVLVTKLTSGIEIAPKQILL